jgi:hypothetical protein
MIQVRGTSRSRGPALTFRARGPARSLVHTKFPIWFTLLAFKTKISFHMLSWILQVLNQCHFFNLVGFTQGFGTHLRQQTGS